MMPCIECGANAVFTEITERIDVMSHDEPVGTAIVGRYVCTGCGHTMWYETLEAEENWKNPPSWHTGSYQLEPWDSE